MLRAGLRLFFAAIFFTAGIVLVGGFLSAQETWFTAALGAFALGKAMFWIGAVGVRSTGRLRLVFKTSLRVMALLFMFAGALALIGGLRSLGGGFALVAASAAVCWMWGWGWFFLRSRRWFQPRPIPAGPTMRRDAGFRRATAASARKLLNGELTFPEFLSQTGSGTGDDQVDQLILEHEPVAEGVFGVRLESHARYIAQIASVIDLLERDS